ncbi:kinase-like protein [Lichtheimia hyalospora FSU 10163]|nr:kinase-like protein [Lichtheimia hyalospora FSU 10163]
MNVTHNDPSPLPALTLVDKVIESKYQILEELGSGSFGYLFLGQSLEDNSFVAIKALCKSGLNPSQLELQQLEVSIQTSLDHSHLLALHETCEDQDHLFMIMDLCDQGDLFDYRMHNKLHQDQVVSVFVQILDAVDYMHKHHIYHRDLKLENILLATSDEHDDDPFYLDVKVGDFGLATRERFHQESGCGSVAYLAPEHFNDINPMMDAAASDVWSLGILLIALLFGRQPWQEANPQSDATFQAFQRNPRILKQDLFPSLSMATYRFLISVLVQHPSDRPVDIEELKQQFLGIDHLLIRSDDDDDENETWPVAIPTTGVVPKAYDLKDSAIFSCNTDESWSDLVDEEEALLIEQCSKSLALDKEEQDIFVHEEELWWLQ